MKILHGGKALLIGAETVSLDYIKSNFPNLKVIGCPMTSIEHLPISDFEENDTEGIVSVPQQTIKVIYLKGEVEFLEGITSTAEHTMGLIIALLRNYKTALNTPYQDREFYKGHTLKNKTLSVLGHGRIGRQIEAMAVDGFKMKFIYNDLLRANGRLHEDRNLGSLLAESDILSVHIPLRGNESFFTQAMFQQMKPTAYFINTSRSKIVEDGALLWALESKTIAGAAVDFIDDPELVEYARTHDNLVLTNHLGGATFEDMARTEGFIVSKIEKYLNEEV